MYNYNVTDASVSLKRVYNSATNSSSLKDLVLQGTISVAGFRSALFYNYSASLFTATVKYRSATANLDTSLLYQSANCTLSPDAVGFQGSANLTLVLGDNPLTVLTDVTYFKCADNLTLSAFVPGPWIVLGGMSLSDMTVTFVRIANASEESKYVLLSLRSPFFFNVIILVFSYYSV